MTVYISSLPIIINKVNIIFPISGICAKLLAGPMFPMPGPMPAIQVATELLAVFPSSPIVIIMKVPIMNVIK